MNLQSMVDEEKVINEQFGRFKYFVQLTRVEPVCAPQLNIYAPVYINDAGQKTVIVPVEQWMIAERYMLDNPEYIYFPCHLKAGESYDV